MSTTSIPVPPKLTQAKATSVGIGLVQTLFLTALFTTAAVYESRNLTSLLNTNVWIHLRTGTWILETHSLPHHGVFSQYSNLPWMDSSWIYDVLLAGCNRLFGLRVIPLLLMLFKTALAIVTYLLARAGKASLWTAVFLSALAQFVIPVSQSLPYVASIIFFDLELLVLQQARQTGRITNVYWMPALFLLWANLHVLFVSGLLLLALFVISVWAEDALRIRLYGLLNDHDRWLPRKTVALIFLGSLLATFVNPYTYHLFPVAYKILYSDAGFQYFAEMRAMSFRLPQDYVLMLLVMAGFLALGRSRSLKVFELLVLVAGTLIAFRIQREAWLAVLPTVAILSQGYAPSKVHTISSKASNAPRQKAIGALLCAAIMAVAIFQLPKGDALLSRVSQSFPVKACDFIRSNHLPQPIFNEYSWGSFLTWYLPEYPVAIDGRTELYGDDITENYFQVIAGGVRLDANPSLAAAQTLLFPRQSGVVKALTTIPGLTSQYRLAYSDDVAAVFVRQ